MLQLRCHNKKELNWNSSTLGGEAQETKVPGVACRTRIAEGALADASGPLFVERLDANQ
jgi:hypothetical protein